MKSETKKTRRTATLAALALLFVTHWLFYKIELEVTLADWVILTEFLYFFVFYAMILCDVPPLFPGLWMLCGCGGLCVLHELTTGYTDHDVILPLPYLPILLFFLVLYSRKNETRTLCFSGFWSVFLHAVPWAYPGLLVFAAMNQKDNWNAFRSSGANYSTVMLLLLCVLYVLILRAPAKRADGAGQGGGKRSLRQLREPFVLAVVIMLETAFFLRLYQVAVLFHTIPLLWFLNLLLLYAQEEPLVCAFAARWGAKATAFTHD